jgi:LuxR family transcriptional activator of conjugal transfer of Ti plasmids
MDVILLERLLNCRSEDKLLNNFKYLIHRAGIDKFAYFSIPNDSNLAVTVISDYPAEWLDRYISNQYTKIDPTVSIARVTDNPFTWAYSREIITNTKALNQYWGEASEFNLKNGVSFPLEDMANLTGFGFSLVDEKDSNLWLKHHKSELVVLTRLFHFKFSQLTQRTKQLDVFNNISARELECAQWLSTGLTAMKVAHKMNITERTVRYHLGQLKRKLNLQTKEEIIASLAYHKIIEI